MLFGQALVVLAAALLARAEQQYTTSSGRHVCGVERFSDGGPIQKSYCIPHFQSYVRLCEPYDVTSGYCTGYRTVYRTVTKLVQRTRAKRMAFICCPGWSREPLKFGCTKPICDRSCQNKGVCKKPNQCKCEQGFEGKYCEKDIDECKTKNGGCDQYCVNMHGSFFCKCREGYKLAFNRKACEVCLSCSTEWKNISSRLDVVENVVRRISRAAVGPGPSADNDQMFSAPSKHIDREIYHTTLSRQRSAVSFIDDADDKQTQDTLSKIAGRKGDKGERGDLGLTGQRGEKGEMGQKGEQGESIIEAHTEALKVLVEKVALLEAKLEKCQCGGLNVIARAKRNVDEKNDETLWYN